VPAASATLARALLALVALIALVSGCAGAPDRAQGTVRYRDPMNSAGKGGTVVAVTTGEIKRGEAMSPISPEDMGQLLGSLDEIGLFGLAGRPAVPSDLPPGSIGVDTTERKFFVTLQDLKTKEDSACFARCAYRIVAATQGGPHYTIPK
jgi:hypothetical protein